MKRITKKQKRDLCEKISNLNFKLNNKVLNIYDLLELDYEILKIYEKSLNRLKDKFIILDDEIVFNNHKIKINILFNKTTNNLYLLELNLNNKFKKEFEFNNLNDLMIYLNDFNENDFNKLIYL